MCRWSLHCFLAFGVTLVCGCGGGEEESAATTAAAETTVESASPVDQPGDATPATPAAEAHAAPEQTPPQKPAAATSSPVTAPPAAAVRGGGPRGLTVSPARPPVTEQAAATPTKSASPSPKKLSPDSSSWSPDDLVTAARQKHGLLAVEVSRRALDMSDAAYVKLVQEILKAGTEEIQEAKPKVAPVRPSAPPRRSGGLSGLSLGVPGGQIPKPAETEADGDKDAGPGPGDLSGTDLTRAVIEGLLINDSNDAWETIESIVNAQLETPMEQDGIASLFFESAFGLRKVSPVMLESTARSHLISADSSASMLATLTSLGTHTLRREMYLPVTNAEDTRPADDVSAPSAPAAPVAIGFSSSSNRSGQGAAQRSVKAPKPAAALPKIRIPAFSNRHVAEMIRGQDILSTVLEKLAEAGTGADSVPLLRFAGTLPRVSTRHAIYKTYERGFASGPGSLVNTGVFDGSVRDPGQLVVLKSLPREPPRRSRRKPDTPGVSQEIRDTWTTAVWQVANALRHQLREVARDSRLEFTGSTPIRLHSGVEPDATIQLTLADESSSNDGPPLNTQVYYSRATFQPKGNSALSSITKHYVSKTKGTRRERQDEGVLWFDGFRGRDGKCSSLDVMIQRAEGSFAPADATAGTSYLVEAIAVVVTDPRLDPNQSSQSE